MWQNLTWNYLSFHIDIFKDCQVDSEDSAISTCCSDQKNDGCCNDNEENGSVDQFPQCRRTAFAFFLNDCSKKFYQTGNNQNPAKFAKDCAKKWKELSPEEKAFYHKLSKDDKSRYEREIQEYKKQIESQNEISEFLPIVKKPVETINEINEIKSDDLVKENTVNSQCDISTSIQSTLDLNAKLDQTESDTLKPLNGVEETINSSIDAASKNLFADDLNVVEQISDFHTPSVLTVNDVKENILESLKENIELPLVSNEESLTEKLSQTFEENFSENDENHINENTYRPFTGDDDNLDDMAFDLFCTDEMPKVREKFNPLKRRMSGEEMLDELLQRWNLLSSDLKNDYFHKAMQSL